MRNAFLKGLIIGGLLFSMIGVSAANIASSMATYSNVKSKENVSTVQEAIDELYHTIGPVYAIYNNGTYQLSRTLPTGNTADVFSKYYFDPNNDATDLVSTLCVKKESNQVECFEGNYYEEKNKLISFFGSENCTENTSHITCNIPAQSLSCYLSGYNLTCSKGSNCQVIQDNEIQQGCP